MLTEMSSTSSTRSPSSSGSDDGSHQEAKLPLPNFKSRSMGLPPPPPQSAPSMAPVPPPPPPPIAAPGAVTAEDSEAPQAALPDAFGAWHSCHDFRPQLTDGSQAPQVALPDALGACHDFRSQLTDMSTQAPQAATLPNALGVALNCQDFPSQMTDVSPQVPHEALPDAPVVVVRNTFIDFEGLPQILEGCTWEKKARSCPVSPMACGANVRGTATVSFESFFTESAEEPLQPIEEKSSHEAQANTKLSVGSAGHLQRRCKPCAFYHLEKGCDNGENCTFCHLCEPGEKKRRQKQKWERKRRFMQNRQAAAAAAAAASAAVSASSASVLLIHPRVPSADIVPFA
mmetsp:Transcript_52040/g.100587  ORF Transcript_52040/g.100587 Transcript_52040/m.100587 type:complete len:344 (-) Transcript_52040:97-1128(-)